MGEREPNPEEMWLSFFNDFLHAKGIITDDECMKIRGKIKADYR